MEKKCIGCKESKDLLLFGINPSMKSGRSSRCKECIKEYQSLYYVKNKEYIDKRIKDYYQGHKKEAYNKSLRWNNSIKGKKARSSAEYKFVIYRNSAKKKHLVFTLTLEEFRKLVSIPCNYCGGTPYGIDRLDSKMGYVKENCVSCCTMCNWMKNSYSVEEFVAQCEKIVVFRRLSAKSE